jgi:DNA-binding transcriptional MerR regulator
MNIRRRLKVLGYSEDEIEAALDDFADRAIQEINDRLAEEAAEQQSTRQQAQEEEAWQSA